jgi:hypothetical protein
MAKHWAICQFYEPFAFGPVWQLRRFEVESEDVELVNGFTGFAFYDEVSKIWRVYETKTGGWLGSGADKTEAIYQANYNIKRTPDLFEQVKQLGDPMRHTETTAAEALKRLAKEK